MTKSLGNDISKWQGDVNYDVYKNNSQFVIIKSTEGNGFIDPKFSRNQSEARRVGLPLGYYHFARPDLGNTPEAEADFFLKVVGSPVTGELYVLDYEPPAWNGDVVAWCKAFLDHVKGKIGLKCLIYLNQAQAKGFNWQPVIDGGYGLWIAAYTYDPNNNNYEIGKWPFAAIQQWTNSQQVPGIPAVADGNVFFGDIETFKKYGYQTPTPGSPTNPPTQSAEIQQLKADNAKLIVRAEKAEATAQTLTGVNTGLVETVKQKDGEIKQLTENAEQNISNAVTTALEKERAAVKPYLYYNLSGGNLIGYGITKLFGGDITPEEIKKGGV